MKRGLVLLLPLTLGLACGADKPPAVEPAPQITEETPTETPVTPSFSDTRLLLDGQDTSLGALDGPQQPGRRDPFEAAARPEGVPLHTSTESRQVRRCRDGGGVWGSFGDTCTDTCRNKEHPDLCGQALTDGCDCPIRQCFDTVAGFCRDIVCPADREYDPEYDCCMPCDPDCYHLRLTPEP